MSLVSFRSVKLIPSYLTTVCLLSLGKNTSNMKTCIALIVKYKHLCFIYVAIYLLKYIL